MLINFAHHLLGTTVTSDKVSRDDHESSNLISEEKQVREKGYMAEHFIKPPVNITFTFPCHVSLYLIVFTPAVGQQQSIQFEVYSASHSKSKSEAIVNTASTSTTSTAPPPFFCISKFTVSNSERVCFHNPNYHRRDDDSNIPLSTAFTNSAVLSNPRKDYLFAVTHLSIRIIRTKSSSTPCLCNVDIWASPSIFIPKAVKCDIIARYRNLQKQIGLLQQQVTTSQTELGCTKASSNTASQMQPDQEDLNLKIPEEFLDPITCEIMAIPMLLPCGKNVDKLTLDKFFSSEANFGRSPRDPFTGVEFSDCMKPIPNGALKTRIDQFLFKHSDNIAVSNVARTVGRSAVVSCLGKRKADLSSHYCSKSASISVLAHSKTAKSPSSCSLLCYSKIPSQKSVSSIAETESPTMSSTSTSSKNSKKGYLKAQSTDRDSKLEKRNILLNEERTANSIRSFKNVPSTFLSPTSTGPVDCLTLTSENTDRSHDTQLKQSLDSALLSLLNVQGHHTDNGCKSSDEDCICSLCSKKLTSSCIVYRSPCDHFICRECVLLIQTSTICCKLCKETFHKSSITRGYVTK